MKPPSIDEIQIGLARLSGISPTIQAILPRLGDDDLDVDELARMVGHDPVLAARVLRLANSSFYGLSRQVGSLHDAVLVLGFFNLRSLVLSTGLISAFANAEETARSLATAAAAGALAKSLRIPSGPAFTAGLLHNLGALLLGQFAQQYWRDLEGETFDSTESRLDKERQLFGFDHCELGADIAGHWHFPDDIRAAIRSYAKPFQAPAEPLTDVVHVAWLVSCRVGGDGQSVDVAPQVLHRLGLEGDIGESALADALQAARGSLAQLGLGEGWF